MAINKLKKQNLLSMYVDDIAASECIFFIDTSGLNVKIIDEFKNKLKSLNDSKYKLIKNTLFKIALSNKNVDASVLERLFGYNAVIFSKSESNLVSKEIVAFSEANSVEINFGLLDLSVIDKDEIVALSKIPNKQVLISNLIYILNSNTSKLLNALNYNTNLLVNSMLLIKDKKEVNV